MVVDELDAAIVVVADLAPGTGTAGSAGELVSAAFTRIGAVMNKIASLCVIMIFLQQKCIRHARSTLACR